jgi:hypothetical protein
LYQGKDREGEADFQKAIELRPELKDQMEQEIRDVKANRGKQE